MLVRVCVCLCVRAVSNVIRLLKGHYILFPVQSNTVSTSLGSIYEYTYIASNLVVFNAL